MDQLERFGEVRSRAMFGAFGLYRGSVFFGIISKGRLYFRTGAETRQDYVERGMEPFRPSPEQTSKTYYEVPVDILEDSVLLTHWAGQAVSCSGRSRSR